MPSATPVAASLATVRFGVVVTLERGLNRTGTGIVTSIRSIFDEREEALVRHGLELDLIECDDFGSPAEALRAAQQCFASGCIAIFGPSGSAAMRGVLECGKLKPLLKLATFATASGLSQGQGRRFFRFTKSDSTRMERILDKIVEIDPHVRQVAIYALVDSDDSYAQGLRRDAVALLGKRSIDFIEVEYSVPPKIRRPPGRRVPIIVCAPSAEAVALIEALRKKGYRGCIFAFGSNANFLKSRRTRGTIVVADLDRHDDEPVIRRNLALHRRRFPKETDPSLPSMSAAAAIVSVLLSRPPPTWAEPAKARKVLADALRRGPIDGIAGPMTFTADGESVSPDSLCILGVTSRFGHRYFVPIRGRETPRIPNVTMERVIYYGGGAGTFLAFVQYLFG